MAPQEAVSQSVGSRSKHHSGQPGRDFSLPGIQQSWIGGDGGMVPWQGERRLLKG